MTKAKISEYDAVASNNTDVNGVNIAEGCPPSGMNNMGREIMAALKRFQVGSDGDGVTVGGNLVVSGSSTLSTTSISSADINAGTIDGTAIGGSTPAAGSFTTLNTSGAVVFNDAGADVDFRVESDTVDHAFFVEGSSGNVGIGTSSPTEKLTVAGAGLFSGALADDRTSAAVLDFSSGVSRIISYGASGTGGIIAFRTASGGASSTERMRITSVGFVKASNTGSYTGSTNGHEFISSLGDQTCVIRSTNASFDGQTVQLGANRSATSAYSLLYAFSNLGASPDLEFNLRGDGNAYADGSWNGSGADYAEYFESATGEAIPRGTTVVLENNKVRAATADDPASSIIGVVRPKEFGKGSMVVGNLAWNMWTDKYITDDFGVYEMEDHEVVEWEETITDEEGNTSTKQHSYESHAIPESVTVPADATRKTHDENGKKFQHRKLNPNYDPAAEYTPREERPEWLIIGLLGQVPVLKGQPVGDRWVKMRDISEAVEEWFIR